MELEKIIEECIENHAIKDYASLSTGELIEAALSRGWEFEKSYAGDNIRYICLKSDESYTHCWAASWTVCRFDTYNIRVPHWLASRLKEIEENCIK